MKIHTCSVVKTKMSLYNSINMKSSLYIVMVRVKVPSHNVAKIKVSLYLDVKVSASLNSIVKVKLLLYSVAKVKVLLYSGVKVNFSLYFIPEDKFLFGALSR